MMQRFVYLFLIINLSKQVNKINLIKKQLGILDGNLQQDQNCGANDQSIKTSKLILESPSDSSCGIRMFNQEKQSLFIALNQATASFIIKNSKVNILEMTSNEELLISSIKSTFQGLTYNKNLIIDKVSQWKLIIYESFGNEPYGWSNNQISTCGGIQMLGGYGKFGGMEVTKEFQQLQSHQHLRIVFNYHYIDSWNGENSFARANVGRDNKMEYIWNDRYDFSKGANGVNICGNIYPENKLSQLVDITIRHSRDVLILGIGSTLDQDPFENSWGISNLQIYIK